MEDQTGDSHRPLSKKMHKSRFITIDTTKV